MIPKKFQTHSLVFDSMRTRNDLLHEKAWIFFFFNDIIAKTLFKLQSLHRAGDLGSFPLRHRIKSHNCYKQAKTEKDVGEQDGLPEHMKSNEAPPPTLTKGHCRSDGVLHVLS